MSPPGNQVVRILRLVLFLSIAMLVSPPVFASGERMALVIGNSRYERQPRLDNPERDAQAIANVLRGMGFAVEERTNLRRSDMLDAVIGFADRSRDADVALVYYAGHGVQVARDATGENYLVPVDAKLVDVRRVGDEAVSLSRVLDELGSRHGALIVLLDACRDNPMAAQMAGQGTRAATRSGLAPVMDGTVAQGSLLAFAAAPGKVAEDGAALHSPFAGALIDNLPKRGVDVGRMLQWVALDVDQATGRKQQPEILNRLRLRDELYLAGPATSAAAAAQVPPPRPSPAPIPSRVVTPTAPSATVTGNGRRCETWSGHTFCE